MSRLDKWGMRRGDVVYCDLLGAWEHTGIYTGRGQVVHLVNEDNQYGRSGRILRSRFDEFLDRLNGFNQARTIYVACDAQGDHIGLPFYAQRAESLRREHRGYGYNLMFRNCHQFTSKCLGCAEHVVFPFWNLERHLKDEYEFDHWERWLEL